MYLLISSNHRFDLLKLVSLILVDDEDEKDDDDDYKQLLDEVFVISGIIKVEVSVISRSRRLRLITLTVTLITPDITKTESNNCFIRHCFEENKDKRIWQRSQFIFKHVKMYN